MRQVIFLSLVGWILLSLSACYGGDETPPAPPPASTAAVATTAAAVPANPAATPVAGKPAPTPTPRFIFVFIDADIEVGEPPLTVKFGTWDPYQSLIRPTYRWDFGDGSPISTERSPVHVFEKPGNYDVKLFVEDGGITDEDSVEIQVRESVKE